VSESACCPVSGSTASMRQPTGSPRLYTLFSVQFFGLPGPKKYVMSPRRISLPVFCAGACADTCNDAIASPATTTADDRMMVSVLRIPDLLYVSSTNSDWCAGQFTRIRPAEGAEIGQRVMAAVFA